MGGYLLDRVADILAHRSIENIVQPILANQIESRSIASAAARNREETSRIMRDKTDGKPFD